MCVAANKGRGNTRPERSTSLVFRNKAGSKKLLLSIERESEMQHRSAAVVIAQLYANATMPSEICKTKARHYRCQHIP